MTTKGLIMSTAPTAPTTNLQTPEQDVPLQLCQPGDTECINRWIAAFTDCH
jgi:hypothetical protein